MALERFANTPTPAAPSTPWTTLNGAITSGALSLTVTSASAFPSLAQFRVLIDSEWILITAGAGTSTWTVTRGVDGSTPTAHAHGALIFHVLTAAALLRNPRSMTTLGDMEYMASDLGPARLAAPSDGDYVTRWTSGVPSWIASGGGGTPGGSSGQLQYNNTGAFGGTDRLAWSSPNLEFTRAWSSFTGLANPTTPPTATATLASGNIEAGDHVYVMTFVDADGYQTSQSADSNTVTLDATHERVDLVVPVGPTGTVARNIFRRDINQGDPIPYFIDQLADNVTTAYQDNTSYNNVGANPPYFLGINEPLLNRTIGGLKNGSAVAQITSQGLLVSEKVYWNAVFPNGPIIMAHDPVSGNITPFLHYTGVNVIGQSFFLGLACGNLTNTGDANFGLGYGALPSLTSGYSNTGFGLSALASCTSGLENVAVGQSALFQVTTGFENVAIGAQAGGRLTTGSKNVCIGKESYGPTTGHKWIVVGEDAGADGTSGDCNILIGVFAGSRNAGTGTFGVKAGSNNTLIGEHTGFFTDGDFSNTLVIGHQALVDASNKAVIGNASVTDVYFGSLSAAATIHAAGAMIAGSAVASQSFVTSQGYVTAHALLSATHTDTTAGSVARGDLITGQDASPTWKRLAKGTANQVLAMDGTATDIVWTTLAGSGDVVGPAASVDNAIVRFNGTTGKSIQDYTSGAPTISDSGSIALAAGTSVGWSTDLFLFRGAANILEQRNSTTAQSSYLYNTYSDASNWEALKVTWLSNSIRLFADAAGSGTFRNFRVCYGGDSNSNAIQIPTAINSPIDFASVTLSSSVAATGRFAVARGAVCRATSGTHFDMTVGADNGGPAPTATSTLTYVGFGIKPTVNYSAGTPGAGSYEALKIAVTETALPTGTNYLVRASAGAAGTTDKFTVKNNGDGFFAGTLSFGTHTGLGIETVTGYITVTDAGGATRKLAVVS